MIVAKCSLCDATTKTHRFSEIFDFGWQILRIQFKNSDREIWHVICSAHPDEEIIKKFVKQKP